MSGMDRRSFFKIVATTGAAAAAGGCGPSAEQFIPYVIPPDNIVPGIPAYFSTVCRECPSGCGLIAKNRDGRVIKLEGNPDHPTNTGSLCIRAHAGLQGLYHPDRFRGPDPHPTRCPLAAGCRPRSAPCSWRPSWASKTAPGWPPVTPPG